MALDFDLFLRGNTVEATAAGVTVDNNDAEAVVHFVADALECREGALVDCRLEGFGASEKVLFFGACLADEVVEVGLLLFEELALVVNRGLDVFDFGVEVINLALVVTDIFSLSWISSVSYSISFVRLSNSWLFRTLSSCCL